MTHPTPDEFLDQEIDEAPARNFAIIQSNRTAKADYASIYRYINITSHSTLGTLHRCGRKYGISKIPTPVSAQDAQGAGFFDADALGNVHFAFGHSVGAGIQTYLVTGNLRKSLLAGFLAWNIDYAATEEKKGKSIVHASLAIEKFAYWWDHSTYSQDWEVATFNGKPATELTAYIDLENGYYHVLHVDVVLRHKHTGEYMVLELKTTGFTNIDEAAYGNSDQALGYSVVVDSIADSVDLTSSFNVLYVVYATTQREFHPMVFKKSRADRAGWLQSILLDHARLQSFRDVGFFPKDGESCFYYGRRCQHFGTCDASPAILGGGPGALGKKLSEVVIDFHKKEETQWPEHPDFVFTLTDLVNSTRNRVVSEQSVQENPSQLDSSNQMEEI